MSTTAQAALAIMLSLGCSVGCSSSSIGKAASDGGAGAANEDGNAISLSVGPDARTFVTLAEPAVVERANVASTLGWDIALQGHDVFINGGISGPGNSSAFGPLDAPTYLSDTAPAAPLMLKDRAGGALLDWYDYGGKTHQLFSRYHVYGLRDGERLFKLQVLSYYGEREGAPVAALYHVRYAEVTAEGDGTVHDVLGIDGTANGTQDVDDHAPSGCLELDTEQVTPLTPAQAAKSSDWQLCFRREGISVNGGESGPRGVEAVDLQAAATPDETEAEIQKRTAASEQKLFDGTDFPALSDASLAYRVDGVVTAFGQRWLEPGSDPLALNDSVWLVLPAAEKQSYLLRFSELKGDPALGPATLQLETKLVLTRTEQ